MLGPNVTIASVGHPLRADDRMPTAANGQAQPLTSYGVAVTIGDSVWIGAGSVVTRDIPADSLAVDNPARVIRSISNEPLPIYDAVASSLDDALNDNFSDN